MRRGAATVLALVAAGGCSGGSENRVVLDERQRFRPETVTVAAGAEVTWVVEGGVHTVTAYDEDLPEGADYFATGGFENERSARAGVVEGLIRPGEEFSVTFEIPGTYRYFCIPHEALGMRGEVVVEAVQLGGAQVAIPQRPSGSSVKVRR